MPSKMVESKYFPPFLFYKPAGSVPILLLQQGKQGLNELLPLHVERVRGEALQLRQFFLQPVYICNGMCILQIHFILFYFLGLSGIYIQ